MKTLLAALIAAVTLTHAHAANITSGRLDDSYLIVITGKIEYGDDKLFAERLITAKIPNSMPIILGLSSNGGNLDAGLTIGRVVHRWGVSTAVASNDVCASVCAAIWLAGKVRYASVDANIGFHAASDIRNPGVPDGAANALLGAYYSEIGLGSDAIAWLSTASPTDISWLDFDIASRLGIPAVRIDDGRSRQASRPGYQQSVDAYQQPMTQNWAAYGKWIQLASRDNYTDAVALAQSLDLKDTFVFESTSRAGWYVVAVGPFNRTKPQAALAYLMRKNKVPPVSRVATGKAFGNLVWRKLGNTAIASF